MCAKFDDVPGVTRFDGTEDVHRGNVSAAEGALVHDLFDARAGGGDLAGEIGETARPIADHGGEAAEPPIGDEPALNHAAEDVWVDVAAANQEHAVFAGELFQFVDIAAASGVAAAPSTTDFSSSTSRRIASAISSSLAVIARSTWSRAIAKALSPTCGIASPSARVGRIVTGVGSPTCNAAEKLATFSASTATIFVCGRKVLIASETPAIKPPPPTGTTTRSTSGTCSRISRPIVPWPEMIGGSS